MYLQSQLSDCTKDRKDRNRCFPVFRRRQLCCAILYSYLHRLLLQPPLADGGSAFQVVPLRALQTSEKAFPNVFPEIYCYCFLFHSYQMTRRDCSFALPRLLPYFLSTDSTPCATHFAHLGLDSRSCVIHRVLYPTDSV